MKNLARNTSRLFSLLSLLLYGCNHCGANKEVSIIVSYIGFSDMPTFTKIVSEGANRNIKFRNTIYFQNDTLSIFTLPVNSKMDSTRYFFFRPGRTDTVTIGYVRDFEYTSDKCGFNVGFGNSFILKNTLSKSAYIHISGDNDNPGEITFYN